MLLESPPLFECQIEFEDKIILKIARLVFGITPEQVEPTESFNMVTPIFHAICERFVGITVNDIAQAFSDYEPKEKVYVLSRKDFIEPIQIYWNKKMSVVRELKNVETKAIEENNSKQMAQIFRTESQQLYLDCLNGGTGWTGTAIQAHTFAKNFKDMFSQEFKDKVWQDAKTEFAQQKESFTNAFEKALPPVPAEYIFSRMIVQEALTRKFNLIIE